MNSAHRTTWLAGLSALLLVLVAAGFAAGRTLPTEPTSSDTVASFEDRNGNGVDDDCEENEVSDPTAAASAESAVDLDGDGTISTSEAAQSDRIGGKNCNHGGYVSWVAQGACAPAEPVTEPVTEPTTEPVTGPAIEPAADEAAVVPADCAEEPTAEEPTTERATDCVGVPAPERDPALDLLKNGHGKWVSTVARSTAVGGKNCNHGGAVSEAAKKDHEAAKAAREAAKAERAAAKAERAAARADKKAAREVAKAAKQGSKGKSRNR
jgi:hypothetical protein